MMRSLAALVMPLALTAMACSSPFPCNRYCWSHEQEVLDLTDEDLTGVPDGRFDLHCDLFTSSQIWYPPLPPFGWYAAERCLPADTHQIIDEPEVGPVCAMAIAPDETIVLLAGGVVPALVEIEPDGSGWHRVELPLPAGLQGPGLCGHLAITPSGDLVRVAGAVMLEPAGGGTEWRAFFGIIDADTSDLQIQQEQPDLAVALAQSPRAQPPSDRQPTVRRYSSGKPRATPIIGVTLPTP